MTVASVTLARAEGGPASAGPHCDANADYYFSDVQL
jgi:hypothetical protein